MGSSECAEFFVQTLPSPAIDVPGASRVKGEGAIGGKADRQPLVVSEFVHGLLEFTADLVEGLHLVRRSGVCDDEVHFHFELASHFPDADEGLGEPVALLQVCLLYTSDAADE